MKKLLSALMVGTIVSSSSFTIAACSKNVVVPDIYIITDAGKVTDKSFNESGYNGGNIFLNNILSNINGFEKYNKKKIAKIEPENTSSKVLRYQYTNAKNNGAKTLILPGFHHASPGEGESQAPEIMKKVKDGSTIMLDGFSGGEREIGFSFRGDISGFYAGMGAIVWSLRNNRDAILGTFGGLSFSSAVDNFMVGFIASIKVANHYIKNDWDNFKGKFNLGDDAKNKKIKEAYEDKNGNITYPKSKSDPAWYSNSFAQGDGKAVTEKLIEKNANVIMPVAGPQTLDVLGLSKQKDNGNTIKVIGVDTNQAETFSNFKNYFITSAEKDLVNATIAGLAHTNHWKNVTENSIIEETSKYLKDVISITENKSNDVNNSDFQDVELNEENSWEGRTLWVGGNMSSGNLNLLEEDDAEKIKKMWTMKSVTESSKYLFEKMGDYDKENKSIVCEELVKKYADIIIENSKKGGIFNE